jgi:predicted outer membrane protein
MPPATGTSPMVSGHAEADSAQALLNFIMTVNRDAIDAARLATATARNGATRAYAQRVIKDATTSIDVWTKKAPSQSLTVEDSSKAKVKPLNSSAGQAATANGMAEVRDTTTAMRGGMSASAVHSANTARLFELKKATGAAFDVQYIKTEIERQNAVLKELTAHPTTYDALQTPLTQFRSMIEDHRSAARKLAGV